MEFLDSSVSCRSGVGLFFVFLAFTLEPRFACIVALICGAGGTFTLQHRYEYPRDPRSLAWRLSFLHNTDETFCSSIGDYFVLGTEVFIPHIIVVGGALHQALRICLLGWFGRLGMLCLAFFL